MKVILRWSETQPDKPGLPKLTGFITVHVLRGETQNGEGFRAINARKSLNERGFRSTDTSCRSIAPVSFITFTGILPVPIQDSSLIHTVGSHALQSVIKTKEMAVPEKGGHLFLTRS